MSIVDNVILNENACFYLKKKVQQKRGDIPGYLPKSKIKKIFKEVSNKKTGWYLMNIPAEDIHLSANGQHKDARYSLCVFKCKHKPTFLKNIDDKDEKWLETKLCYFLLVEYNGFVIITKRGVTDSRELSGLIEPVEYIKLSRFLLQDNAAFEKFALRNMNISNNVIRQKSLEAFNLKYSFSPLGANNYLLDILRLDNANGKYTLSPGTARVNQFARKKMIEDFIKWSTDIADKIADYQFRESYLDIFATPMEIEKYIMNLEPRFILFSFDRLITDLENMKIKRVFYRYKQNEKDLDLIEYINDFKTLREIVKSNRTDKNGNPRFMIVNPTDKSLELRINKKSLTLKAAKLKNIIIQWEAGDKDEESLLSYLNRGNEFVIHFSNYKFIYFARKLFSDNKLLGDLDGLMRIFKPYEKLAQVNSEKGLKFTTASKTFSPNSIFGFVEEHFGRQTDFLICDDLGNEWADHIGLSKDAIMFIHSKYGKPGIGASQFQDVNGQAQKNLGNMVPADHQWEGKRRSWANYYKIDGAVTRIDRIRKGTNADDAVAYYKRLLNDPNVKKQVYLVINFLSKSDFRKKLIALRQGNQVTNNNQVIQLLWFISSLISSCWETGTEVYICCAP